MVVPEDVSNAAGDGERGPVLAWLDAGNSVNEMDAREHTLLMRVSLEVNSREKLELARELIRRGADVNLVPEERPGYNFNMVIQDVDTAEGNHVDLLRNFVLLLLEAGLALENTRAEDDFAPLVMATEGLSSCPTPALLNIISDLLRFGSPMDAIVFFPEAKPIEFLAGRFEESNPSLAQNEHWVACRKLFAAVRAAGTTWIGYRRVQRKRVLRMRSLMVRGRALPRRTRGSDPIIAPIFRLPNELCWHVLQFWRATCDATGEVI